ncbi:MAG: hypothetical protein HY731_07920 [Candidatus Tectomicrobia bacterium]|nr:hypothetical protein [Candidatus Tectomicrobia bacterium]
MISAFNDSIERLFKGSIDMHLHAAPDPAIERRQNAIETARHAKEAGMRAIVFKSHDYPTAPLAYIVSQIIDGIKIFGAIALDKEIGGLNPLAVEVSGKLDAKIVWMPTFTADNDSMRRTGKPGIRIIDESGKLLPVIDEILGLIKQYDMILGTGHLSRDEIFALVDEARRRDIKTVATHATFSLSVDDQKAITSKGALIEHSFLYVLAMGGRRSPQEMFEVMKAVGPERGIMSTDLGQAHNMPPVEGIRMFIATLLRLGMSERDIALMVKENPARLLGL